MNRKEDMGKENTDSKLDTEQVHQDKPKTGTSEKLKFTDYAIGRFITTFENKIRRYTSFDVSKNGALKGLKLCQYKKTLKKYFVLKYWFHKKSSYLTIGEFIPGKFGTKECQDRVFKLVKAPTDDRGLWIKDPKAFVKAREKKVFDK